MNLRWICIILLSMEIARAVPSSSKKEMIPKDAKIFIEDEAKNNEEVVQSRQRRVGPEPVEMSMEVKDTGSTTMSSAVINRSMNETKYSVSEAKDMEETSVSPKDNENTTFTAKSVNESSSAPISKNVSDIDEKVTREEIVKTASESTTTTTTTITTTTTTTVSPVKIVDEKKLNETKLLEMAKSTTVKPEPLPKNASRLDEVSPELREKLKTIYNLTDSVETNVTITTDTITPLYDIIYSNTTSSSSIKDPVKMTLKSEQEKLDKSSNIKILDNKNEKTGMPSGIVALIIAIAFAIFAVIGYAGLLVWKRYLEYRYGNRELLVNDFDANDINNFEL